MWLSQTEAENVKSTNNLSRYKNTHLVGYQSKSSTVSILYLFFFASPWKERSFLRLFNHFWILEKLFPFLVFEWQISKYGLFHDSLMNFVIDRIRSWVVWALETILWLNIQSWKMYGPNILLLLINNRSAPGPYILRQHTMFILQKDHILSVSGPFIFSQGRLFFVWPIKMASL